MNSHNIVGRLTKAPELKQGTKPYARFTIAVNRDYGEEVDFFDCVVFGKTAEYLCNYGDKGLQIASSGSMQLGSYENKEGRTIKTATHVSNRINLLQRKESNNRTPQDYQPPIKPVQDRPSIDVSEDDLPF